MNLKDLFSTFDGGDIFDVTSNHETRYFAKEAGLNLVGYHSLTEKLRSEMKKKANYNDKIGSHPDFSDLKEGETEYHYIVSVFVDIKGSTNLSFKYDLETVREIKNKILASAIEIFQAFDGNIHRMQGDAIFTYFGGKGIDISNAIINSLNASTILQLFVNDYLKPQFVEKGIDPLKLRIGIDLGHDDKVLWSKYGVKDCYEITTTSLHTDLAAKLQSECTVNRIMIGENIVRHIDLPNEFLEIKQVTRNGEKKDKPYIIKYDDFKYKMWHFKWENYCKSFHLYNNDDIFDNVKMTCQYTIDGVEKPYISNSKSLPKEVDLDFALFGLHDFSKYQIKWKVINRGKEANVGELEFEMTEYENKIFCNQSTAFMGHHYMECKISKDGKLLGKKRFGVYIGNT